jgi:hypothetical protein
MSMVVIWSVSWGSRQEVESTSRVKQVHGV